jgi:FkbM family methyltransferase
MRSLVTRFVPTFLVTGLAWMVRLYTRWVPVPLGKRAIVLGESAFRIFDVFRIEADVETTFGARMHVRFPDVSQKAIFFCGFREPAITAFLQRRLERGDVFIDIGANIGYYTCLAARLAGPEGQVHAIEPSPRLAGIVEANARLNDVANVTVHPVAVMDRSDVFTVTLGPERSLGRTTVLEADVTPTFSERHEVRGMPLDQVIAPEVLHRAKVVKIDVEGAEWHVVNHLFRSLGDFDPHTEWVIEVSPEIARREGGSITRIIEGFRSAGYSAHTLENHYDVGWYVREGRSILAAEIGDLVRPLPKDPESVPQVDLLFSRSDFGRGQRGQGRAVESAPTGIQSASA